MSAVNGINSVSGPLPPQGANSTGGSRHSGAMAGFVGMANLLGMSAPQLRQDLQSGQTLQGLAQASGKSVDDLANAFLSGVQSAVNNAVSSGRINQTQGDNILSAETNRINNLLGQHGESPVTDPSQSVSATSSGQIVNASA